MKTRTENRILVISIIRDMLKDENISVFYHGILMGYLHSLTITQIITFSSYRRLNRLIDKRIENANKK